MELAERFLNRFSPCSNRCFGEYREGASEPAITIKRAPDINAVKVHLNGQIGLGLVPLDEDRARWGAIDIDNHGKVAPDLKNLAIKFKSFRGVTVARSKSGGAHIYVFLKRPVSGRQIRSLIHKIALSAGLEGNEVFPKQNKIRADGFGNWINLPYFGGDSSNRFGIYSNGDRMSLENFLSQPRTTPAEIDSVIASLNIGAPPCIQHLLSNPPVQGYRNNALFSLAVFFRRSAPNNWQDKTREYVAGKMDPPLKQTEINALIRSVGRKDYTYRCTEAPLIDLCDKNSCRLAKHGLTAEEQQGDPIKFLGLTKYLTEPPVFDLRTELGDVRLGTKSLLSYAAVREAIAEKYLRLIPRLKTETWHAILSDLMSQCTICPVPEDSTPSGLIWNALVEYSQIASEEDTTDVEDSKWQGGIPIRRDGVIYFRGNKFIEWLRRSKRAEGMNQGQIYMALKDKGIESDRKSIGGRSRRSWAFKASKIKNTLPEYIEETDEF